METGNRNESFARSEDDRRAFLRACGRFAVVTPPAISVLLSTSLNSSAIAASGGGSVSASGGGGAGSVTSSPVIVRDGGSTQPRIGDTGKSRSGGG